MLTIILFYRLKGGQGFYAPSFNIKNAERLTNVGILWIHLSSLWMKEVEHFIKLHMLEFYKLKKDQTNLLLLDITFL